jgi:transposase
MDHFAGLDVSVKETSICILDDTGRIVREVKVASEPEALLKVLGKEAYRFKRIRLEAGPLSQWLYSALAEAGLPVICVETRHMRAVLKAQINKTDRNDARGIAQMMRVGLYRPVHVKTLRSQKLRTPPIMVCNISPCPRGSCRQLWRGCERRPWDRHQELRDRHQIRFRPYLSSRP